MTAPDALGDDWPDEPSYDDHDPYEWFPPGEITADEHRDLGGWRPVVNIRPGGDLL